MDRIYHEKQEGHFCAQHCLNNLLQGSYFTFLDLTDIARDLDAKERSTLAHTVNPTTTFNYDDSGFYSIQVIMEALKNFDLEVVPYGRHSAEAEAARKDPTQQTAFICNFNEHWLAIRRLGRQWFDLNSILKGPKLISNTFLSLYLAQLTEEKYSIFFVRGNFPECDVDLLLLDNPVTDNYANSSSSSRYHAISSSASPSSSFSHSTYPNAELDDGDLVLRQVLEMTRAEAENNEKSLQKTILKSQHDAEEDELRRALRISAQYANEKDGGTDFSMREEDDDVILAMALGLSKAKSPPSSSIKSPTERRNSSLNPRRDGVESAVGRVLPLPTQSKNSTSATLEPSKQNDVDLAITRSLENDYVNSNEPVQEGETPDAEFIRNKRAAYFEKLMK